MTLDAVDEPPLNRKRLVDVIQRHTNQPAAAGCPLEHAPVKGDDRGSVTRYLW
jgi:hypothetical protein